MRIKNITLLLGILLCLGLSGCHGKESVIDSKTDDCEDSNYSAYEVGDDEENFTFTQAEAKKVKNGFKIIYKQFSGSCTWLKLETTESCEEVMNISLHKDSDDVKLYLISSDGTSEALNPGKNKMNLEAGTYRIVITGKGSNNTITITYDKSPALKVSVSEYFDMDYDFDGEATENNLFSKIFRNMFSKENIKSLEDITDDMILNEESAYFDHSNKDNKGDCLKLEFEGFTGIYRWCDIKAKKQASITVHMEGSVDEKARLVLVQEDNSIQNIEDGEKFTLDKGKAKLLLCGYKAKGDITLTFTYDKKRVSISGS